MLVACISLIVGQFRGLFWLVPTILFYLVWSLNNAWWLVVQVSEEESKDEFNVSGNVPTSSVNPHILPAESV
jgi:hypothetical protein